MNNRSFPTGIFQQEQSPQQIPLGSGAFSKVFKIIQKGQPYALKKISKVLIKRLDRLRQLTREIEILKKIDHPNIVKFVSFNEDDKQSYIIKMQFCEGHNLRKFLLSQEYQKLSPTQRKYFSTKICLDYISALAEVRSKMVSNRDIKPDNIVVKIDPKTGKIETKMIDFGEARFNVRNAETQVGTNGYMAPQIYFSIDNYDQSCDYWSLGQCFYEIFEGVRPDSFWNQYLGSPFKENFMPSSPKDYQEYYHELIFTGISLTKSRTPGPFQQIIRGLLNPIASERMSFAQMLEILKRRFLQIKIVLQSEQEREFQFKRLEQNITKEKYTIFQKKQLKDSIEKIQMIHNLYKVFSPNLPLPTQSKVQSIMKLIIFIFFEIQGQLGLIQQIMHLEFKCIFEEILIGVISSDQFTEILERVGKYDQVLTAHEEFQYEDIKIQVGKWVTAYYANEAKEIMELLDKIFQ